MRGDSDFSRSDWQMNSDAGLTVQLEERFATHSDRFAEK
jgi:hypothetical protein